MCPCLFTLLVVGGCLCAARPTTAAKPVCQIERRLPPATGPTSGLAWRAAPIRDASLFSGIPGAGVRRLGSVSPGTTDWLLVLGMASSANGGCWVEVRLPGPPNTLAGWVSARRFVIRPTPWRLVVSRSSRTLTVFRNGRRLRVLAVVVGKPSTPTPRGLFSIVDVWRSEPDAFVGSWVLGLTAHSDVLRHFEGGTGEVGIHGRGGESLLDPLGSAASHGCIRLANRSIDWLVRTVGRGALPGIPVIVRR